MKKLKKYLLTSLSLGLAGISVGAIVASCADDTSKSSDSNGSKGNGGGTTNNTPAAKVDPADPANGTLTTTAGQALTAEQQTFQTNTAAAVKAEIDKVFDSTNNKLKTVEGKTEDQLITEGITKYQNNIKNNAVLNAFVTGVGTSATNVKTEAPKLSTNFKQKNLLPSLENLDTTNVTNFFTASGGKAARYGLAAKSTSTDVTETDKNDLVSVADGILAAFYLDPTDISMLALYYHIASAHDSTAIGEGSSKLVPTAANFGPAYLALVNLFADIGTLISAPSGTPPAAASPAYQTWNYYSPIANAIKNSIY